MSQLFRIRKPIRQPRIIHVRLGGRDPGRGLNVSILAFYLRDYRPLLAMAGNIYAKQKSPRFIAETRAFYFEKKFKIRQ